MLKVIAGVYRTKCLGTTQSYYLKCQERFHNDYTRAASSLLQAEQDLLALVRSPAERNANHIIWLRTCYFDKDGNTTDEAHENLFKRSNFFYNPELFESFTVLFDNARRYNYGPGGWQKIFTRIPQLVDNSHPPEELERRKAEALEEAQYAEDNPSLNTYSEAEESDWILIYSSLHWLSAAGVIFVVDEEAIETGEVLLAWYDDCGRVVRSCRVKDTVMLLGILIQGAGSDLGYWGNGEIGDDYDLGGAFGPPYD